MAASTFAQQFQRVDFDCAAPSERALPRGVSAMDMGEDIARMLDEDGYTPYTTAASVCATSVPAPVNVVCPLRRDRNSQALGARYHSRSASQSTKRRRREVSPATLPTAAVRSSSVFERRLEEVEARVLLAAHPSLSSDSRVVDAAAASITSDGATFGSPLSPHVLTPRASAGMSTPVLSDHVVSARSRSVVGLPLLPVAHTVASASAPAPSDPMLAYAFLYNMQLQLQHQLSQVAAMIADVSSARSRNSGDAVSAASASVATPSPGRDDLVCQVSVKRQCTDAGIAPCALFHGSKQTRRLARDKLACDGKEVSIGSAGRERRRSSSTASSLASPSSTGVGSRSLARLSRASLHLAMSKAVGVSNSSPSSAPATNAAFERSASQPPRACVKADLTGAHLPKRSPSATRRSASAAHRSGSFGQTCITINRSVAAVAADAPAVAAPPSVKKRAVSEPRESLRSRHWADAVTPVAAGAPCSLPLSSLALLAAHWSPLSAEDVVGARRSARVSLPPLAHWRNERLAKRESGDSVLVMHFTPPASAVAAGNPSGSATGLSSGIAASANVSAAARAATAAAGGAPLRSFSARDLAVQAAKQLGMRRSASLCRA